MDQNDGFYVHLCSSDSMGTYPKNTCSNFVNLLAKPLDLDTNWEVGLTEFQYTNSIYNVTANSNFALFDFLYEWEDKDEFGKKPLIGVDFMMQKCLKEIMMRSRTFAKS